MKTFRLKVGKTFKIERVGIKMMLKAEVYTTEDLKKVLSKKLSKLNESEIKSLGLKDVVNFKKRLSNASYLKMEDYINASKLLKEPITKLHNLESLYK